MPPLSHCRLSPLNMPDYAEVACSTFKSPTHGAPQPTVGGGASLYDSCGAYATTNVVANVKLYQNRYATKPTQNSNNNNQQGNDYQSTGMYSAPPSAHYGCLEQKQQQQQQPNVMTTSTASTAILTASPAKLKKINITENKMDQMDAKTERTNPFNQQQQLLLASNALKQGLGAYANTTLAAQMANGGGAGTLRRQRQPKTLFKSENNILGKSGLRQNALNTNANATMDFLTGGPPSEGGDFSGLGLCNSTNQLLNDWASSASIAAPGDYHFGSKQPNKQHLYVKAKDGTWSAVSSDAYQSFKHQQQQQHQQHHQFLAGSGDNNKSLASVNSLAGDSKFLSSFGSSSNV